MPYWTWAINHSSGEIAVAGFIANAELEWRCGSVLVENRTPTQRNIVEMLHDLDKKQALLVQEVSWIRRLFEEGDFVRRSEFLALQRIVYGAVWLILAGVVGAVLNLVLK